MVRLTLDNVGEGMVTEEAVLDDLGNVVLREGVELTRRMIDVLRHRGVAAVSVSGGPEGAGEASLTEEGKRRMRRQIDEKMDHVFAGHAAPLMLELAEASKRFLKGKIS